MATSPPSRHESSSSQHTITLTRDGAELHGSWHFPNRPGPFPTLLILPGGRGRGQVGVAWPHYHWVAEVLAERGLASLVLDYASRDREPFDVRTLGDINAVLDVLKRDPRVRSDSVFLMGFSLGGANALRVAGSRASVSGLITYFAPVDWRIGNTRSPGPVGRQPIEYVEGVACPVLILQGDADEITELEQARRFERALRAKNASVNLVVFEHAGHGFTFRGAGTGPCCRYDEEIARRSFEEVVRFIEQHGHRRPEF